MCQQVEYTLYTRKGYIFIMKKLKRLWKSIPAIALAVVLAVPSYATVPVGESTENDIQESESVFESSADESEESEENTFEESEESKIENAPESEEEKESEKSSLKKQQVLTMHFQQEIQVILPMRLVILRKLWQKQNN